MKKSFILFCTLLLICIIGIVSVNCFLLNENDKISISESEIYGTKTTADNLSIETHYCSDSHMFWDNNYLISTKNISSTEFSYSYNKKINNKKNDYYLSFNPQESHNSSVYSNMYKYSQKYTASNGSSILYITQDTYRHRVVMVTSENGLGWLVIYNSKTDELIQKLQIITADSATDYFGISNIFIYDKFIAVLDTKGIISLVEQNNETGEYALVLKTQSVLNDKNESPFNNLSGMAWNGQKLAVVTYDKQYFSGESIHFLDYKCSFLVYIFNKSGLLIYNGLYYNKLDDENIDFTKNDGSEMIYSGPNKFSRCRPVKNIPISVNWN